MTALTTMQLIWVAAWIAWFLTGHFISDFVLQTPYMAVNKSKSNKILATHVWIQTTAMCALTIVPLAIVLSAGPLVFIAFIAFNFVVHFAIDWCTARISTYFFKKEDMRHVFQTIGIDQFLHLFTYVVFVFGVLTYIK